MKMKRISCAQWVWVLDYLERYKHLTPLQALKGGGSMRLAARIGELRNQGHNIRTEMAVERGRRFARYWLE